MDKFEKHISALLHGGDAQRPPSAKSIIAGARRRRLRHRATGAGATLTVLGIAAATAAFTNGTEPHATATPPAAAAPTKSSPTSSPKPSPTRAPGPNTCSPALPNTNRTLTVPLAEWTTLATGTTAGQAWTERIRYLGDGQTWAEAHPEIVDPAHAADWIHGPASELDAGPDDHDPAFMDLRSPEVDPRNADSQFDMITYRLQGPIAIKAGPVPANWDHVCMQYKDRATTVPTIRVRDVPFVAFAMAVSDQPEALYAYDAQGKTVAKRYLSQGVPMLNPSPDGGPVSPQN